MKIYLSLLLTILSFKLSSSQTILNEGDIAITGIISNNPEEFTFVLLKDITSGTEIHFTDCGWFATGGFRNYDPSNGRIAEGSITWTATSDLNCGTEVLIIQSSTDSNIFTASTGTVIETDNGYGINATLGDQLFAFQGSEDNPTFLFAIHFGNNDGWSLYDTDVDANHSAIPAGLTDGINAINLGNFDNGSYNCTVTSNQTLILNAVSNINNWTLTNSRPSSIGGCIYSCNPPNSCPITVTYNGTWSGTPNLNSEVIIASNYDTSFGSFSACSLTINSGVRLTVNNASFVEVQTNVIVNGELFVETQANFIQNDNTGTFIVNPGGDSRLSKQTATKQAWYYYTYWSSPVTGQTISSAFPDVDGDRRFWYNAANFLDINGDDIDDNGDDWQYALGTNIMNPGVGYACTSGRLGIYPSQDIATFIGPFNTGDITTNIYYNPSNLTGSWNFIGNPYPSAIDFTAFHAANALVVEGAAYLWSQSSPPLASNPGNEVLNFNQNDYATFTVGSGGAAGASGIIPTKYIPSAQGFFISGKTNGTVTFKNAMRMADGVSNSQFFKNYNTKKNSEAIDDKIWLNLTSNNGVFSQLLVAYVDGATNAYDGASYDAYRVLNPDFPATIYSKINNSNKKFVIQGKAKSSLTNDETITIGFATNISSNTIFTLSIEQLQGDFMKKKTVFLIDSLLNSTHNLSESDYSFTSETGEFNERFKISFSDKTLSTINISQSEKDLEIVDLFDNNVQFNHKTHTITSIRIYDLLGRELYYFACTNKTETHKISNLKNSIYIAKVELVDGTIITKKALKK